MLFLIDSDRKATVARPAGNIQLIGPEGIMEFDTTQCCHCGFHTPVIPGNPAQKFCVHCNGVTCMDPRCHTHVHSAEQKMDLYEKGKLLTLD